MEQDNSKKQELKKETSTGSDDGKADKPTIMYRRIENQPDNTVAFTSLNETMHHVELRQHESVTGITTMCIKESADNQTKKSKFSFSSDNL